jgi:hypothetical protein
MRGFLVGSLTQSRHSTGATQSNNFGSGFEDSRINKIDEKMIQINPVLIRD